MTEHTIVPGFRLLNAEVASTASVFRAVEHGYPVSGDRIAAHLYQGEYPGLKTRRFFIGIDIWKGVRA